MPAMRLTPLLLGSSLAATSSVAFALGLGDATPRSALGEPLQLNIPINIGPGEEVGEHCFTLRPAPFNQASGLPTVTQGSVTVMRSAAGKAVLRVSTSTPVDEPMIALGIETRCKINVARDYSVFLSPPSGGDAGTTLAADTIWDAPANHAISAAAGSEAPAAVQATVQAANEAPAAPASAAQPIAAAPAALPTERTIVAAVTTTKEVAAPRPAPVAVKAQAADTPKLAAKVAAKVVAKVATNVAAVTPATAPQARATAHLAAAPAPRPAAADRDAQLAELTASVNALRAQIAAQEKRLQELSTPQAAPLRVSGQYRPDSVIPATLNVPIARHEAQTVVYRAAPVAVPQSAGVSLETLGIVLLITALAAAGSGHYVGRRATEGRAGSRAARSGRRPVRRPRD